VKELSPQGEEKEEENPTKSSIPFAPCSQPKDTATLSIHGSSKT
jgi:hypothetical protein